MEKLAKAVAVWPVKHSMQACVALRLILNLAAVMTVIVTAIVMSLNRDRR